jgi:hypothetical protein
MPTSSLTPTEIDGLNYDDAKKEVYACGFKGTWIANATAGTLRSLLKGEVTPIDAATITLNAMEHRHHSMIYEILNSTP